MPFVHNFELVREERIPEIRSLARLWRHAGTGARLLSLVNDDVNKVFGVSFRTPPRNSTGVAHILEHSVLCGSRLYPVKEPFVELLKGSLQTFLNAMTYPDKTCYPVASANLQDFYNLVDVYLDAVFHPLISEPIFRQEGWHIEAEDPNGPMRFKGVVYNEMKGAYSSPDSLLLEYTQQALYPDNSYGLDSGGDPARIPELTYEEFKEFHERYYHPSNAWFFFHGDDPEEDRLLRVDKVLAEYSRIELDSSVGFQPSFREPVKVEKLYSAEEGEDNRAMLTVSWLLPETRDAGVNLALHVLEHALIGLPASPLYKALIDSGLGEDIAGSGLEAELRQMYFSTGLKGMDAADAQKVERLIIDTLEGLVRDGLPKNAVDAALNTVEFDLRENNTGRFPVGLALMLRSLTTWLYDHDPLALLAYEKPLNILKDRLASGERVLEAYIRDLLLNNPHRVTLLLRPDADVSARAAQEEDQRLSARVDTLDQAGREALAAETRLLRMLQEAPDTPEALASIPRLHRSDLDRENRIIPCEKSELQGAQFLYHDIPTNGVAYLDLGFNLSGLPADLVPLAPVFGRALLEMGAQTQSFVEFSLRIARDTGGIDAEPLTTTRIADRRAQAFMLLRGKATTDKAPRLLDILRDVLLTGRLDDRERFKQIVLEEKARLEQRLIPAGHSFSALRLRARFSEEGWLNEQMDGVEQLFYLRRLAGEVDADWPSVIERLHRFRRHMLGRDRALVNVTQEEEGFNAWKEELGGLIEALPEKSSPAGEAAWNPQPLPRVEGLAIPAQVNYVGKAASLFDLGWSYSGSALVISKHLRMAYLWDQVRVQGGAYGAFCTVDRSNGVITFNSYRDPNLERTLRVFDGAGEYLERLDVTPEILDASIVGGIGEFDPHLLPDAKGMTSMVRDIQGLSDRYLQQLREEMLGTRAEDFKEFAGALRRAAEAGHIVAAGSRQALEAAGLPGLKLTRVL